MQFTPEQEENLVKQYDPLIKSVVSRFKRRSANTSVSRDDLYQECMLVFLLHIRKAEDEKQLSCFPFRDMTNAMCRFTLSEQAVSVPYRTSDYSKRIKSMAGSTTLDVADAQADKASFCEEAVFTSAVFNNFMNSLSEVDRSIVRMKLNGLKNREVSRALGLTDVIVTRRLKRMRTVYAAVAA